MRKNNNKGGGKKKEADAIDEVEELLKLTQQDLLLNLSTLNSPIKSKSYLIPETSNSNLIDPDLDRRFQALRSTSSSNQEHDVDHLFARFAALKPPSASNSINIKNHVQPEHEDEDDEVQKIINWAKDAARLDPSPSSDEDDDHDHESDDDDESDDDETAHTVATKKKGLKK